MKLKGNVKYLQSGGEVQGTGMVFGHTYSPMGISKGTGSASSIDDNSSSKSKDSKKKDDLIDNDTLKQLVGKGITSDVNVSMQGILQLQTQYDQLTDVDKNSSHGMMLLNRIQLQSTQVNHILRNAEQFKNQQERVVQNNALNEVAVTDRGVIIQHLQSGRIMPVSPEQLSQLSEDDLKGYRLLTNAELINEREYNTALQFDNTQFQQLNDSTGFINIKKEVKEILATVSASSEKSTYDSYTDPTGKLAEGLQQLKNLANTSIDNIIQTISNESNNSQLILAIEAIWSTLGDNSKTFLKQRALMSGQTTENIDATAKSFIVQLAGPKGFTKTETEFLTDLGAAAKSGGKTGDKQDDIKFSYWEHVQNDMQEPEIMLLEPHGDKNHAIEVPTRVYGQMRDKSGTIYETKPIGQIAELARLVISDAGSFGGEDIITSASQMGMVYNGSPLYRRTLPYIIHPDTKTPIPDYQIIQNYQKQMEEIEAITNSGKTIPISTRQQIFKSHGIDNLDAQGNPRNIAEFFQVKVYMGKKVYKELDKSSRSYLIEDESEAAKLILERAFAHDKTSKKANEGVWKSGDDVYTGVIYYPARLDAGVVSGAMEDGPMSLKDYTNRKATYQTTIGKINRAAYTPHNMDMLNRVYNNDK